VAEALLAAGFSASRREAERLIVGGGVKIDGVPVGDPRQPWAASGPVVLSVGTRRFVRILPRKGT
jgi:tyrosyl-tRNA synthetase